MLLGWGVLNEETWKRVGGSIFAPHTVGHGGERNVAIRTDSSGIGN